MEFAQHFASVDVDDAHPVRHRNRWGTHHASTLNLFEDEPQRDHVSKRVRSQKDEDAAKTDDFDEAGLY